MGIYLELPVYKTCFELAVAFAKARAGIPRDSRYTLAQDLDRALMDVMVLIYRANAVRAKEPLIARARQLMVEVQIRLRILNELHHISTAQYARFVELSDSAARQFVKWHRSVLNQNLDAKTPSVPGGRPESVGSRPGGARRTANPINTRGPTATREATPCQ